MKELGLCYQGIQRANSRLSDWHHSAVTSTGPESSLATFFFFPFETGSLTGLELVEPARLHASLMPREPQSLPFSAFSEPELQVCSTTLALLR